MNYLDCTVISVTANIVAQQANVVLQLFLHRPESRSRIQYCEERRSETHEIIRRR